MSNPVTHAFFIGRATAEALIDKLEDTITDALSALGKFDAEQREQVRIFTESILERASQAEGTAPSSTNTADLQELIDNLRAEVAQLKSELHQYSNK